MTASTSKGPAGPGSALASSGSLPAGAFAAALAALPGMGPRRLAAVLASRSPLEAWKMVAAGGALAEGNEVDRSPGCSRNTRDLARQWQRLAAATDVAECWAGLVAKGIRVGVLGQPEYPPLLATDHEAPAVVFWRGEARVLDRRRVAIVGTRRCTRYGLDVARELGRDLASEGVAIVSGLARGIDSAAHTGALEAAGGPPVAVVGSGPDVVYPRENTVLWERVAGTGLLCGEAPPGAAPEAWRFPVRNRIIAALCEVMVVVESHARGGSRHSVEAAEVRDRTVMAVPGSVRSSASDYPNQLLVDGCAPARDATDVLVALGLTTATRGPGADSRPPPHDEDATVLTGLGWEPASLEQLVVRTARSPAQVGLALARLERDRWVASRGGWWERLAQP